MSLFIINASTLLQTLIRQKAHHQRIGILAVTCTIFFLAIKFVKNYKRIKKPEMLLDLVKPTEIVILENGKDCGKIVDNLIRKTIHHRVVGLDCEWVCQERRRPIALLQLATSGGYCVLIRLSKLSTIPVCLSNFLEDSSIIKVGLAIKSDVNLLRADYNINVFSCLDINVAAKSVGFPSGSLKLMARDLLQINLNKDKSLQCSNWEVNQLSSFQIEYAALDALIPVKIIEKIMKMKMSRQLDEMEGWIIFLNLWHNVLDVTHKHKNKNGQKQKSLEGNSIKLKQQKAITIKKKLYENCFLQDPDEIILCVCNNKKLDWYIERNLGVEVSECPRTVKLNFQPKLFKRTVDNLYYVKEKENKCVVCGQTNSLRRKNVVPCEYRAHFPKEHKEYKSHDIVLLCALCHTRSTIHDQNLRRGLIAKCDAPVWTLKLTEEGRRINKLKYAANALLMKNPLISVARIEEIKTSISEILNCDKVTDELLLEIKSMKIPAPCDCAMPHGKKVVKYFIERNELLELEIMWRNHFINTMQPRHLPELWTIESEELPTTASALAIIKKCKKIVTFFHNSSKATAQLRKEMRAKGLQKTEILQDVSTRWNSSFYMLQRINELIDILNVVVPRLKKCTIVMLNTDKMEALPELIEILRPFEVATTFLSGSSYPSISLIIPTVKGLNVELDKLKGTFKTSIATAFFNQLKNFMKRLSLYEERTPTHLATLLDPRFKEEGFCSQEQFRMAVVCLKSELKTKHSNDIRHDEEISTPSTSSEKKLPSFFGFLKKKTNPRQF